VVSINGLPGSNTGPEGTQINVSANITGPGAGGPYTYAWSVTKQGAGSPFATGTSSSFSFTPDDNGTYNLSLTVTDSATQQGVAQQALTITNANPTATIVGAPANSDVGTLVSLTSNVTDPGALDTTFTYSWTVMLGSTQIATGSNSTFSFTPETEGTYDVTFTATDDDTGNDSDIKVIQVEYTQTQGIIAKIYQALVDRLPDFAGLQYWTALITGGLTPSFVTRGVMNSLEYRQIRIEDLYQQYLVRSAETGALLFWSNYLANGGTELGLKTSLLVSGEYRGHYGNDTAYVESLYTNILGRSADSGGTTFWLDVLNSPTGGASTVVQALLLSSESYRRLTDGVYQTMLNRSVDNGGADYWVTRLISGELTLNGLFEKISNSVEFANL
jgi:hypothetical protein